MKHEELVKFIEERVNKCKEVISKKGLEYGTNYNVLKNFFYTGMFLGENPEKVAFMYMLKHFESLKSIIYDGKITTDEVYEEKITDLLNYLFIIDALIKERRNQERK